MAGGASLGVDTEDDDEERSLASLADQQGVTASEVDLAHHNRTMLREQRQQQQQQQRRAAAAAARAEEGA